MLSRSSTSETHTGHREPCERFRRRQAESGNRLTECDLPVIERWRHNSAFRKCDDCKTATREQAKIRRTAKRKAKMAARKQEVQKKRRFQEHGIMASATSIEAAEETDQYVNTLPPMQAQEFMIHQFNTLPPMQAQEPMMYQDTIVKTELPTPPRYNERQTYEDIAWNSIPDTFSWEASLQYEAAYAQPQPVQKQEEAEAEVKEERNSTTSISPCPPSTSPLLPLPLPPTLSAPAPLTPINSTLSTNAPARLMSSTMYFSSINSLRTRSSMIRRGGRSVVL